MNQSYIYLKALCVALVSSSLLVFLWFKLGDNKSVNPNSSHEVLDQMETQGAFDFKLRDMNQKEYFLSQFKGKIIILNFWASWCNPCLEEFPSMVKLINEFKGEIVMLAVSNDSKEKEIRSFLKSFVKESKSPHLTVLWDKDRVVAKKYKVTRLPETFILDQDLKLVRKVVGVANWYNDRTREFFNQLLPADGVAADGK